MTARAAHDSRIALGVGWRAAAVALCFGAGGCFDFATFQEGAEDASPDTPSDTPQAGSDGASDTHAPTDAIPDTTTTPPDIVGLDLTDTTDVDKPDVGHELTPDTPGELPTDLGPDTLEVTDTPEPSDVPPDLPTDVPPDVPADVSPDVLPDVLPDVPDPADIDWSPAYPTHTVPVSPANNNAPTVHGVGASGAQVTVYAQAGCAGGHLWSAQVGADGTFDIGVTVADDTTTVFSVFSALGPYAACSEQTVTYVEDSAGPQPPDVDVPASTAAASVTAIGVTEGGAAVTCYTDASCSDAAGQTTAAQDGNWVMQLDLSFNSANPFYCVAEDEAGNSSGCPADPVTVIHDDTPPDPVSNVVIEPDASVVATNVQLPEARGVAEAGTTVTIHADADCQGESLAEVEPAANGIFETLLQPPASEGPEDPTLLYFLVTDATGNTSACVLAATYLLDSEPPAFAGMISLVSDDEHSALATWNQATDNFTPAADIVYDLSVATTLSACLAFTEPVTTGPGTTALSTEGLLADVGYVAAARARDGAGNVSDPGQLAATRTLGHEAVLEVVAGGQSTCAIMATGAFRCWGHNNHGQLGGSTEGDHSAPGVIVPLARPVISAAVGREHTCVVDVIGEVWCWGRNHHKQAGHDLGGGGPTPVKLASAPRMISLTAGAEHTCGVGEDGRAWCWGHGKEGRLGDGDLGDHERATPAQIPGLSNVVQVAAGSNFTCARLASGDVWCWGNGANGRLGEGGGEEDEGANRALPVHVQDLSDATAVAAGEAHACAARSAGGVVCWGADDKGQIGNGPASDDAFQPRVTDWPPNPGAAVELVAGGKTSCARVADGRVFCWGNNGKGEAGRAGGGEIDSPQAVPTLSQARTLAMGENHTFVITGSGTARGWGNNPKAPLGTVLWSSAAPPADLALPLARSGPTTLSVGDAHACVARSTGTVECWGANTRGQLGLGDTTPRAAPEAILVFDSVVDVAAGGRHTCALDASGVVTCWGDARNGQVGAFSNDPVPNPVQPDVGGKAVAVEAGSEHTCAVMADRTVRCWGRGSVGQLGTGAAPAYSTTGEAVSGLSDVTKVSAGGDHTCGLTEAGRVSCWGANDQEQTGQFGTEMTVVPSVIWSLYDIVDIATSSGRSCALRADGGAYCWGGGNVLPLPLVLPSRVRSLALGPNHACAARVDGLITCWGEDGHGQLGDGPDVSPDLQVDVPSASFGRAVGAGNATSCVLKGDGSIVCWGLGVDGALGTGSMMTTSSPSRTLFTP